MGHAEVGGIKGAAKRLYPWECRERHISYRGKMTATLEYTINNGDPVEFEMDYGKVPIMVRVGFLDDLPQRRWTRLRALTRIAT